MGKEIADLNVVRTNVLAAISDSRKESPKSFNIHCALTYRKARLAVSDILLKGHETRTLR